MSAPADIIDATLNILTITAVVIASVVIFISAVSAVADRVVSSPNEGEGE